MPRNERWQKRPSFPMLSLLLLLHPASMPYRCVRILEACKNNVSGWKKKAASTTSSARASATLLSMKMQEMRDTMLTVCCLSAWHTYVFLGTVMQYLPIQSCCASCTQLRVVLG